mgnify:CR=1 FL=1
MVDVLVGYKPGGDVVAEGGEKTLQIAGVLRKAAVDGDDLAVRGAQDIAVHLDARLRRQLPEREGLQVKIPV